MVSILREGKAWDSESWGDDMEIECPPLNLIGGDEKQSNRENRGMPAVFFNEIRGSEDEQSALHLRMAFDGYAEGSRPRR
jgi:hypothetical protein